VPQGSPAVPRSKYTVLRPGDHCSYATQGIVAIGHNTGAVLTVCTSVECEKHSTVKPRPMPASNGPYPATAGPYPANPGANPDAEDDPEPNPIQGLRQEGRADRQPPRDLHRIELKVKAETAAQLRREFTARIFNASSADNMDLLAFMVAYAVEDYAEDFLTFWGVAPTEEETDETGGEPFDRLLAHLAGLSGKEQTAAIFDMLLYSAGECDAYNYRASPTVAKAAQLYGVNIEEVETRIRRGIMAEEAPQIPQEQPAESADSEAAAEPGNDATPSLEDPEDQLDEPEMPELQDAEDATAAADEAEEQPAEAAVAAQDDEEEPAEAQEQPTANAEAALDPGEEPAEAQGTPKPPKPRSRAGKGSGRTKRAATTLPAKAAKKRTAKG
jgi:hypothetical protein